jgi:hypothetical protein
VAGQFARYLAAGRSRVPSPESAVGGGPDALRKAAFAFAKLKTAPVRFQNGSAMSSWSGGALFWRQKPHGQIVQAAAHEGSVIAFHSGCIGCVDKQTTAGCSRLRA